MKKRNKNFIFLTNIFLGGRKKKKKKKKRGSFTYYWMCYNTAIIL